MVKKNTVAAIRIKGEMKERSLTSAELAELVNLPRHSVENILAGKSSKLEKISAIAKVLGKPLSYFTGIDQESCDVAYDADLHCNLVKIVGDVCKKKKIFLTKEKMDKLVNFTYPRLNKSDPEQLIIAQAEAIISYVLKTDSKAS